MEPDTDRASPFSPPPNDGTTPTLLIALALIVLVIAGVLLFRWWSGEAPPSPPARAELPIKEARSEALAKTLSPQRTETSTPSSPSPAAPEPAWSRCEIDGRVVYRDGGCQGGELKSSSTTTQAALSTVPTAPNNARGQVTTVYRCKSYSGVVFWSSKHCHGQKALVERMVTVPSGLSFKAQVAEAKRLVPRERVGPPAVVNRATRVPDPKARQCKALSEKIRQLDAKARQPQSGHMQDWLREQRQAARDEQFVLHC
jgi:hypothetical protein